MEGDLSLSQSLGGLRIANPDAASSPSSQASDTNNHIYSTSPPSAPSPSLSRSEAPSTPSLFQTLSKDSERAPSPLGFNPNAFSTESISLPKPLQAAEKQPSSPPKDRSSFAQRQANRQSIPLTYQDQQQAQFPQYPTIMPLNQRHPSTSSRPVSALYTQTPPSNTNSAFPRRQSSYRRPGDDTRKSNVGIPQRSNSRGASASAAMQAGVPSEDRGYSDRTYRNSQQITGANGTLPPRRSSRGMGNVTSSPATGPPMSSSEEWEEKGAAVGVRQEIDANGRPVLRSVSKGVKDFNFGRTLGEGSYSTVMAATDRKTNREYAMKVLSKHHIIKEKKVKYVTIEKDALNRLTEHPGVVRLYYTFQDQRSLYYVLDLCTGGELLGVLKRMGTFDEECTRFYGAQILDTIDFMHSRGVIHRDLKPENVLLDDQMHVKITDFGTAKLLDVPPKSQAASEGLSAADNLLEGSEESRANSFVGTAEYVSPELLKDKNACKASDLWAFGCIIYQLLAGRPPFKAGNEYLTFQKIIALNYEYPKGFPEVAKDLVERLLVLDPTRRLTIDHIKNHEFFDGIKWGRTLWKQQAPKLKSFVPEAEEPIKLNGQTTLNGHDGSSYPPNAQPSHSTHITHFESGPAPNGAPKPSPRLITELAPPTQLDIEWSPVLTKSNERILKLGNLAVVSSPSSPKGANGTPNGDADAPKKFSRFFGSGAPKKRQRLVMITSSGRVIMAAAGGEEKKTKSEISLLAANCAWRKVQDSKGLNHWCIDTREKHFTFEDPKSASSDGSATSAAAQDWLDVIDVAREMALSQKSASSYSADPDLQNPAPGSTRDLDLDSPPQPESSQGRNTLQKIKQTTTTIHSRAVAVASSSLLVVATSDAAQDPRQAATASA
ncbi:hypothetical protein G7Y79_00026g058760 [Physcia stellaris]|nr:hypothetical protein G7Y79_00026g058760 [Physcia stellaris]